MLINGALAEDGFHVYKITNRLNGRAYIGVTTTGPLLRFASHFQAASDKDYPLYRDMRRQPRGDFSMELLESCTCEGSMFDTERKLIAEHQTHVDRGGYNLSYGHHGRNTRVLAGELRAEGMTYQEIGEALGISTASAWRYAA